MYKGREAPLFFLQMCSCIHVCMCLGERGKEEITVFVCFLVFNFFRHPSQWVAPGLFWPQWLWLVVRQNINEDIEEMKVPQEMLK